MMISHYLTPSKHYCAGAWPVICPNVCLNSNVSRKRRVIGGEGEGKEGDGSEKWVIVCR